MTPSYISFWVAAAQDAMTTALRDAPEGWSPASVAFLQRAYYFQTGDSVALLP